MAYEGLERYARIGLVASVGQARLPRLSHTRSHGHHSRRNKFDELVVCNFPEYVLRKNDRRNPVGWPADICSGTLAKRDDSFARTACFGSAFYVPKYVRMFQPQSLLGQRRMA